MGSDTGLLGITGYSVSLVIPLLVLGYLGPILRKKLPEGVTLTQFILARFGYVALGLTNVISLLYMVVFLISEVTGLGFLLEMYGLDPLVAQIVICFSTAIYTGISSYLRI